MKQISKILRVDALCSLLFWKRNYLADLLPASCVLSNTLLALAFLIRWKHLFLPLKRRNCTEVCVTWLKQPARRIVQGQPSHLNLRLNSLAVVTSLGSKGLPLLELVSNFFLGKVRISSWQGKRHQAFQTQLQTCSKSAGVGFAYRSTLSIEWHQAWLVRFAFQMNKMSW